MKNLFTTLFVLTSLITAYSQDTLHVPAVYSNIQAAIDAANNGDIVLVDDGTYIENINFSGKAITVASHFILDGLESHIENTVIDGSQPTNPDSGSVVMFVNGEDSTSFLCGFTITGGTGNYYPVYDVRAGGGISVWLSGAKICNNIIEYNSVTYAPALAMGGGILAYSPDRIVIIRNNIIRNNSVNGGSPLGGGISLVQNGLTYILSNKIIDNEAIGSNASGGGIDVYESYDEQIIKNNYIKGNTTAQANLYGGGGISLYNWGAPVTVSNNLIVDNSGYKGGGVLVDYSVDFTSKTAALNFGDFSGTKKESKSSELLQDIPVLVNNTIIYNTATIGGGIHAQGSTADIMNSIVWGNTYTSGGQISGTATVTYSDVEGGYTGTGNIDEHPLFIMGSEYYLLPVGSPCVDAGNPDQQYNDVEDPSIPGNPMPPALGTLRNDMGHCGGPNSLWCYWDWPIPVELTSFTAIFQYGKVILNWSTATEINNSGFEVERKIINNNEEGEWVRIGFMEGHGTTTEPKEYSYVDDISSITASSLAYRLKQLNFNGSYEYSDEVFVETLEPTDFALHQNFPNPFNPSTTIKYSLQVKSPVQLVVYNSLGESVIQLINEIKEAGNYSIEFNATELPSGVYFYRLQVYAPGRAGSFVETKKMIILK